MVFITGTLIVLGSIAAIGLTGAGIYAATEDERKAAKKKQLETENESLLKARDYVSGIKDKIEEALHELISAKGDFASGGHVSDGKPLANDEFNKCIDKLTDSKTYAYRLISDFDDTMAENTKQINKL